MICPLCRGPALDDDGSCPYCGFQLPKREDLAIPAVEDFEKIVRRKLGADYHVEALVGRGGMSVVFLARDLELHRPVALKILPLQLSLDSDAAERFTREAQLAASLEHPNIVPVYRTGATPAFMWYAMKYVGGLTLNTVLKDQGQLDPDTTLGVIEQVGSALQYAHRRGVIHRDVKPGNIMVDDEGWVVVCDFGVAKAFGTVPLTQTGSMIGTPAYMAPEQCYGTPADGRADQYALAAVTYECLVGNPPFVADSLPQYVRLHTSEQPPLVTDLRPDVPDTWAKAIDRALSKKPEDRFADIASFVNALGGHVRRGPAPQRTTRPHANSEATPPAHVTTPETPSPRGSTGLMTRVPRRRLAGIAAAGIVALTAVSLIPGPGSAPATGAAAVESLPHAVAESLPPSDVETSGTVETSATTRTETPPSRTAPATVPARPLPSARLFISTEPWGALYVDGVRVGVTPTPDGIAVRPGTRVIRVVQTGFEPYEEEIVFEPGAIVRRPSITLRPSQQ